MNNLTNEQIKELIDAKEEKIEELLDPSAFTLSPQIQQLTKEIKQLQNQCTHSFEVGYCKYCCIKEKN